METMSAPSSHKHFRRHLVGRAVGAIDHDAQAVEPEIALGKVRLANSI